MGFSNWSESAYQSVTRSRASSSAKEIFRSEASIDPLMDPRGLKVREARDSEHHPMSVPIIVAFDVTASMGRIPTRFAKESLGKLMSQLVEHRFVADPQLLFGAVGDAVSDRAPLQVGQFESGLEMDMWLTRIWLESRGGDPPESYLLPHWFATHHTSTDAWEKRGKKGYLFTIGDAKNKPLSPSQIHRVFGYRTDEPTSDAAVIKAAQERWHVFHILVSTSKTAPAIVVNHWRELLPQGLLVLDHEAAINELIGAVLGLSEGTLTAAKARAMLLEAGVSAAQADAAIAQVAPA